MKIYIAGPMSGYPEYNFPAFYKAEETFKKHGYDVVNPASLNVVPEGVTVVSGDKYWKKFMQEDINQLMTCDAIYMLHGWEKSKGASLEHHIAKELGLKVYYENDYFREDNRGT